MLQCVDFTSLSIFARFIGSLPSLEILEVKDVRWHAIDDPHRHPDCNAGFSSLKKVSACRDMGPSCWPIAWILAATCTGYTYRRTAAHARDAIMEAPPPDIAVLVSMLHAISTHWDSRRHEYTIKNSPEPGEYYSLLLVEFVALGWSY